MQIKKLYGVVVGLGSLLLLTAESASAHHAFAVEYDSMRPVELQGKLTKVELMNPHSWLTLEVQADDGSTQTWEVEAGAPNGLYRRGFTRDSLPVGTEVVVRGYRARADSRTANGGSIRVVDGTETFLLGGSNPDYDVE